MEFLTFWRDFLNRFKWNHKKFWRFHENFSLSHQPHENMRKGGDRANWRLIGMAYKWFHSYVPELFKKYCNILVKLSGKYRWTINPLPWMLFINLCRICIYDVETVSKKNDTRVIRRGQAIGNTAIGIAQPPVGLLYITLVRDLFKFGTRASCSTIGLSDDTSDFFSTQTLL